MSRMPDMRPSIKGLIHIDSSKACGMLHPTRGTVTLKKAFNSNLGRIFYIHRDSNQLASNSSFLAFLAQICIFTNQSLYHFWYSFTSTLEELRVFAKTTHMVTSTSPRPCPSKSVGVQLLHSQALNNQDHLGGHYLLKPHCQRFVLQKIK